MRAPRARVDLEAADLRGRRLRPGARAGSARDGSDAREQLAEAERLDEEVVGPELEPDDAVDLLAARRDDDDRDVGARAQLTADRVAVHVRQAQIEQHDVDLGVAAGGERLRAGRRALDGVALAHEAFGQRLGDRVLVFDNQHAHGRILIDAQARCPCSGGILTLRDGPPGRALPVRRGVDTLRP